MENFMSTVFAMADNTSEVEAEEVNWVQRKERMLGQSRHVRHVFRFCFRSCWTLIVSTTKMEILVATCTDVSGRFFFFKLKRIVKNLWAPHGWEIHTHLVSFPCCLVALKARVIIQLCVCIPMWQDLIILIFREKNDALQLCSASSCLGSIVLKTPFWTQLVLFPVLELLSESHYIDAFAFPEEGGSWLFMNASVFVHWWGCELNFGSLEILI